MTEEEKNLDNPNIPNIFHIIPSFAHGGVPIRISYLMNHFGKAARHILFSTNHVYTCESRLNEDVSYLVPDIENTDQGNIISRILGHRRILKKYKPDLLLTYHWGSIEWAIANSFAPLCRHYHLESGFGPEEAHCTLPRRNLFRKIALRNIDGIIVPSQTLVDICKADWGIPEEKILYIPNGVDCDQYAAPPKEGIIPGFIKSKDEVVIGTMTPLRGEKNLGRLITAFRDLISSRTDQNFRLIIMGEGSERSSLEKLISNYGLEDKIFLPGHIDDPARALGWLDIYAISSDTEQMPNSLNQAMAAHLPIVGLDVGDIKFMMHEKNKPFIVKAGDDEAFTKALIELATSEKLRDDLGKTNQIHVRETFDQSRMFKGYADVWGVGHSS